VTRLWPAALIAALFALSLIAGIGCTAEEPLPTPNQPVTKLATPKDVLNEPLMVALAQAKNFHHKADVYLKDAQLDEAIAAVRHILAIDFPAAPEGEDVMLDARARLAKLLVTKGELDEAMSIVDDGIGNTKRESFFLANLYTVRGEVHEARAVTLDESKGQAAVEAARAARKEAIVAFDKSIEINKALLRSLPREAP
jgi:tetratricopeptide (TPR) repeat protein